MSGDGHGHTAIISLFEVPQGVEKVRRPWDVGSDSSSRTMVFAAIPGTAEPHSVGTQSNVEAAGARPGKGTLCEKPARLSDRTHGCLGHRSWTCGGGEGQRPIEFRVPCI